VTSKNVIEHVFGPVPGADAAEFARWLEASPRFRAFAENYRDKLRKKVSTTRDPATRLSLWAELGVAYLLARERRLSVEYEQYGLGTQRAPDFTVRFREHVLCNVEVTCLQAPAPGADGKRLLGTICEKLGQLPAGAINVLALVTPARAYQVEDVARAMQGSASRMKPEDEQYVIQRGYRSARDFRRQAQRLSAVLLRWGATAERSAGLWTNPAARHALPADLARLLVVEDAAAG
jgi:hypothetical protein